MKAAREYPTVTVTAKGTRWLESGHPWVYDSDVAREPGEGECENGALVDVVSEKGKYLGTGFLSRLSRLRVRIVSRNANDRFNESFWRRRVRYAWDYRKAVMDGQTGCCRLIFGEADAFPGLTVDRFENLLVTQTLSLGMEKIKDMLFPLIVEVLEEDGEKIDGLFERNDVLLREKEGLSQNKGWFALPGKETPASPITEICENGVFYRVDVENGQKDIDDSVSHPGSWRIAFAECKSRKPLGEYTVNSNDTVTIPKCTGDLMIEIKNDGYNSATGQIYHIKASVKTNTIVKLTATTISSIKAGKRQATVYWRKANNATGYYVYRSTNSKSGYKKIATVTGKTYYTDKKSLTSKKTYYYKVVSIRKSGSKVLTAKSSACKSVKIK